MKAKKGIENTLKGKSLGFIFEKPSTRTMVSFSVAMYQLGGFPLILDAHNLQSKRGETIHDTALTLARYLDAVVIRALKHRDVEEFVSVSTIPIINGLTDKEHPCQILADILTIVEKKNIKKLPDIKKIKVAFIGDGNNVANSWIAAASILGFDFSLAGPKHYEPDRYIVAKALDYAKKSGSKIEFTNDVKSAVKNADVIYTDVWTSMGEESQQKTRNKVFKPYQVNQNLLDYAKSSCIVMHCLPPPPG